LNSDEAPVIAVVEDVPLGIFDLLCEAHPENRSNEAKRSIASIRVIGRDMVDLLETDHSEPTVAGGPGEYPTGPISWQQ